jgi:hypothetical protein
VTQSDPRPGALPERPAAAPASPPPASGALSPVATVIEGGEMTHTRDGIVLAVHPEGGRCPHCPAGVRGIRWHRVEVHSTSANGLEALDRAVEGDDAWVAASLRALADQLDPPKRPTRADALSSRGDAARDMAPRRAGAVITSLPQPQPVDGTAARVAADIQRRRQSGGQDPMSFR